MGRPERPLDPDQGPLQRFAYELRLLRGKAGQPGYRELARRAHYSATALAEAAGGRTVPSLPVTLAFVRACGGDPQEWEARHRELVEALDRTDPPDDGPPPYPGLTAFQPEDADRYFGRDALVERLVHQVARTPVVAVFGASGSGKSSLIRAGLIPATRTHPALSGHEWSCVLLTPTGRPLRELARAVADVCGAGVSGGEPGWLDRALRQADPGGRTRFLLLIDQFEELFTLCQNPRERAAFIDAVLDACRGPGRVARLVLGIRADFYGHCTTHPGLLEVLEQGDQVLVGPMTHDELRAAITRPAALAGLTVERELVATMIADISDEPGGLPLLAHALLETYRRRRGTTMTMAAYRECGGVHGALAQTAERLYAEFDAAEQEVARQIFVRLTALGDGICDTRRRVRHGELATVGHPATVRRVLDRLAAARLVVIGTECVEVAHEALIRAWPRLNRWLTDDRADVLMHRRITDATRLWLSSGRDPELLYRSTLLDQAMAWARSRYRTGLNAAEREFLNAALHERDRQIRSRRRRALRLRVAIAAVVALLALVSVVALRLWSDARERHPVAVAGRLAAAPSGTDPLPAARRTAPHAPWFRSR